MRVPSLRSISLGSVLRRNPLFELWVLSAGQAELQVIRARNCTIKSTSVVFAKQVIIVMNGCSMCLLQPPRQARRTSLFTLTFTRCLLCLQDSLHLLNDAEWCKFALVKEALNWFAFIYPHIHRTAKNPRRRGRGRQTFSQLGHSSQPVAVGGSHKCFQLLLRSDL